MMEVLMMKKARLLSASMMDQTAPAQPIAARITSDGEVRIGITGAISFGNTMLDSLKMMRTRKAATFYMTGQ